MPVLNRIEMAQKIVPAIATRVETLVVDQTEVVGADRLLEIPEAEDLIICRLTALLIEVKSITLLYLPTTAVIV